MGADFSLSNVQNISALKGMPLKELFLNDTTVVDLPPLSGMPLQSLETENTLVSSLKPVRKAPLTLLAAQGSKVTDISMFRGSAIESLTLDYVSDRDEAILNSMPALKEINHVAREKFLSGVAEPEAK